MPNMAIMSMPTDTSDRSPTPKDIDHTLLSRLIEERAVLVSMVKRASREMTPVLAQALLSDLDAVLRDSPLPSTMR